MKYLVLCVTLHWLFFINTFCSAGILTARYDDEPTKSVKFNFRHNFDLSCNVTSDQKIEIKWQRDGEVIDLEKSQKGKYRISQSGTNHTLTVVHGLEKDAGHYACLAYQDDKLVDSANITVGARIYVKVQSNINVVEGEKLRVHCNVIGNPPQIVWKYQNETYNQTYTETNGRVVLEEDTEKNIPNAILRIEEVQMFDRGTFTCVAKTGIGAEEVTSETMIRIKDKYAALWPFLGICAEVFILCAIIFIYEKKRNKTELEESDTDQSPDQKNTPDNGKDSNLRHRQ